MMLGLGQRLSNQYILSQLDYCLANIYWDGLFYAFFIDSSRQTSHVSHTSAYTCSQVEEQGPANGKVKIV